MYKLFLTLRYLRRRYIAWFAIAAVMLCTAMVLIVMSVMGGFLDQLKRKSRGLLGDIIVDNRSFVGFPLYQEFIDDVRGWPEIVQATPVIYTYGILRFKDLSHLAHVQVVGIRLHEVYEVNGFKPSLYYERFYPDTTTLAEQKQPLLGFHPTEFVKLRSPDGEMREYHRIVLPPALDDALERSWAAGIRDTDSPPTQLVDICREAGKPEIVGWYEMSGDAGPPREEGEPWPGLIIGRDIVARRTPTGAYERFAQYPRGMMTYLTLVPVSEGGSIDTPIKQPMRYVDDSRTGIYEIDSKYVYADFALLQKLLQMHEVPRADGDGVIRGRCSQIQIKIRPGVDAAALCGRLENHYREMSRDPRWKLTPRETAQLLDARAYTWEESQAHIIAPVEKERRLVTTLFAIISLVAALLVLCILYMIVLQKTRDIGIIKSVGGSSAGVATIFVLYGVAIGVVGSVYGAALGYLFVTYINEIQAFLAKINPQLQVWSRETYSFDEIPNTVRTFDLLLVVLVSIGVSTLGSLLAAWRAGSMQPVKALAHE